MNNEIGAIDLRLEITLIKLFHFAARNIFLWLGQAITSSYLTIANETHLAAGKSRREEWKRKIQFSYLVSMSYSSQIRLWESFSYRQSRWDSRQPEFHRLSSLSSLNLMTMTRKHHQFDSHDCHKISARQPGWLSEFACNLAFSLWLFHKMLVGKGWCVRGGRNFDWILHFSMGWYYRFQAADHPFILIIGLDLYDSMLFKIRCPNDVTVSFLYRDDFKLSLAVWWL